MRRTLIILILLLTFTVAPVYGATIEDIKGVWACMTTEAFGFQDGRQVKYDSEKFFLKMKENSISYSGGSMGKGTLEMRRSHPTSLYFMARSYTEVLAFNLRTQTFAWSMVFSTDTPMTYNYIGTCEKFDTTN